MCRPRRAQLSDASKSLGSHAVAHERQGGRRRTQQAVPDSIESTGRGRTQHVGTDRRRLPTPDWTTRVNTSSSISRIDPRRFHQDYRPRCQMSSLHHQAARPPTAAPPPPRPAVRHVSESLVLSMTSRRRRTPSVRVFRFRPQTHALAGVQRLGSEVTTKLDHLARSMELHGSA